MPAAHGDKDRPIAAARRQKWRTPEGRGCGARTPKRAASAASGSRARARPAQSAGRVRGERLRRRPQAPAAREGAARSEPRRGATGAGLSGCTTTEKLARIEADAPAAGSFVHAVLLNSHGRLRRPHGFGRPEVPQTQDFCKSENTRSMNKLCTNKKQTQKTKN